MPRGREVHDLAQGALELLLVDPGRAVACRHRPRAGRRRRWRRRAGSCSCRPARRRRRSWRGSGGIGGRAVDLARVLAREGAAAVGGRTAVGVDDDLAPGQAAVAVRPADHEAAGRVDVEGRPPGTSSPRAGRPRRRDGRSRAPRPARGRAIVLGRDHDGGGAHRLAVLVGQGHLALARRGPGPARRRYGAPRPATAGSCGNNGSAPASAPRSRGRHSRT